MIFKGSVSDRRDEELMKLKRIPFAELDLSAVITERLDYTIYTEEEIGMIKNAAYERNRKGAHFVPNGNGMGPDCPGIVGMEDCSDTLIYDRKNNIWLLTDGLGNGWIR